MKNAAVFEEICQKYIADVSAIDLGCVRDCLGIEIHGETAVIPFYGIFALEPMVKHLSAVLKNQ